MSHMPNVAVSLDQKTDEAVRQIHRLGLVRFMAEVESGRISEEVAAKAIECYQRRPANTWSEMFRAFFHR